MLLRLLRQKRETSCTSNSWIASVVESTDAPSPSGRISCEMETKNISLMCLKDRLKQPLFLGGGKVLSKSGSKAARDNRANQFNPRCLVCVQRRQSSRAEYVNRSVQLNLETETCRKSRDGSGKSPKESSDEE